MSGDRKCGLKENDIFFVLLPNGIFNVTKVGGDLIKKTKRKKKTNPMMYKWQGGHH